MLNGSDCEIHCHANKHAGLGSLPDALNNIPRRTSQATFNHAIDVFSTTCPAGKAVA